MEHGRVTAMKRAIERARGRLPFSRRLVLIAALLCFSCGRITPGSVFRPAKTSFSTGGSSSSSSSGGSYKSVYDDKGCPNTPGESGAKMQAACRSGK